MREIVILLLFLGISSFIKKMMKNAKEQQQNPGTPAGGKTKIKLMESLSELLGVEEPDRAESKPHPPHPHDIGLAPMEVTADAQPDTIDVPINSNNAYKIPEPAKQNSIRKKGSSQVLRRSILLRDVLGPCRAMRPYSAPE